MSREDMKVALVMKRGLGNETIDFVLPVGPEVNNFLGAAET
jgi:hypothetical protein